MNDVGFCEAVVPVPLKQQLALLKRAPIAPGLPFPGLTLLKQVQSMTAEERDTVERWMLTLPQATLETTHAFADGVYARTIRIPEGVFCIGHIRATEHINILISGRCSVWTEQTGLVHYEAPAIFKTVAGTKRYGYMHEDVLWTTIHPTDETDLAKLEPMLIIDKARVLGFEDDTI